MAREAEPASIKRRHKTTGRYLEKHGNRWRVFVSVPAHIRPILGKTALKETLPATDLATAHRLKWAVIDKLRRQIEEADPRRSVTPVAAVATDDSLLEDAMAFRGLIEAEEDDDERGATVSMASAVADRLERDGLSRDAHLFKQVVFDGIAPFAPLVEAWLKEAAVAPRTEAVYRQSVREFSDWCRQTKTPTTVQAITKRVAGRFVEERFVSRGIHAGTANKSIGALRSFWTWMNKRGHAEANPWSGQSLAKRKKLTRGSDHDLGHRSKRPFTDDEVATLLAGITKPLLADLMRVAALTGMRIGEIAELRVRHFKGDLIKVPGTKTASAFRDVPIHPDLATLIARRTAGKPAAAFIFHELPEQTNPARPRGAPATQAFTRDRRALGVDDVIEGVRQSRIDFHSFRRWFIRKALAALEDGATGFTGWTIADVVGRSKEDGPLGMTMGVYPGRADVKALRACVEAVQLPISG
ncbi:tyrosine-type recombinase/integrase [Methylobacterium durans]|uniref:tyrosine-type recombinase/integrase n=1 Tax=Methylobacterium durans TaxID=2202825 RepID=UPI0013A55984|nr:phage integrase N-terminal SAM-like domain-containing protein [Methylobacterium durans]